MTERVSLPSVSVRTRRSLGATTVTGHCCDHCSLRWSIGEITNRCRLPVQPDGLCTVQGHLTSRITRPSVTVLHPAVTRIPQQPRPVRLRPGPGPSLRPSPAPDPSRVERPARQGNGAANSNTLQHCPETGRPAQGTAGPSHPAPPSGRGPDLHDCAPPPTAAAHRRRPQPPLPPTGHQRRSLIGHTPTRQDNTLLEGGGGRLVCDTRLPPQRPNSRPDPATMTGWCVQIASEIGLTRNRYVARSTLLTAHAMIG